jgi:hypothetical protein
MSTVLTENRLDGCCILGSDSKVDQNSVGDHAKYFHGIISLQGQRVLPKACRTKTASFLFAASETTTFLVVNSCDIFSRLSISSAACSAADVNKARQIAHPNFWCSTSASASLKTD